MGELAAGTGGEALAPLFGAAKEQLEADAARLARMLRAMPTDAPNSVTLGIYSAIATARRHAYAWFVTIRNLDTEHPAKADALAALSTLAAALGSWYRALRTSNPAIRQREEHEAQNRFTTAATILERVDEMLGGTP